MRRTLSVRLSVCLSVRPSRYCLLSNIAIIGLRQPCGRAVSFVLFTCQRAAYRTAISAAQAC